MSRPDKFETFMKMAVNLSEQATCNRRKVGCILLDANFHIIGSGYNGNARGMTHCIDTPCAGALLQSGTGLDMCEAIHAEQNALMQCKFTDQIYAAICTTFPCMHCLKMLLNTNCFVIAYRDDYTSIENAQKLWSHRKIIRVNI